MTLSALRITFRSGLCAFALMTMLPADDASAQARLRPIATVTADIVTLGDIFEGAGDKSGIAVFGAPAPGGSGMISTARILAAARDHGLFGVDSNGLSTVAVRRIGRTVGAVEIQEAMQQALIAQQRLSPDTEVELNAGQMEVTVETAATGPVVVRSMSYNGASGRFEATFAVQGSRALELEPARIVGSVSDIVRVPVLTRAILKGDVIAAGDFSLERRRRSEIGQDLLTDPARVIGNAAKRPLGRGSLIREADVQRPEVVERNAVILMTFEQPGLQLSMRGRALQGGAVGETIQVQNLNSRKVVEAVISGPNRAAVTGAVVTQPAAGQTQRTTARTDIRAQ
jgi:flagellar basal body P-ring formation protein FlgA